MNRFLKIGGIVLVISLIVAMIIIIALSENASALNYTEVCDELNLTTEDCQEFWEVVTEKADLIDYYNKSEVDKKINSLNTNFTIEINKLENQLKINITNLNNKFSNYYTINQTNDKFIYYYTEFDVGTNQTINKTKEFRVLLSEILNSLNKKIENIYVDIYRFNVTSNQTEVLKTISLQEFVNQSGKFESAFLKNYTLERNETDQILIRFSSKLDSSITGANASIQRLEQKSYEFSQSPSFMWWILGLALILLAGTMAYAIISTEKSRKQREKEIKLMRKFNKYGIKQAPVQFPREEYLNEEKKFEESKEKENSSGDNKRKTKENREKKFVDPIFTDQKGKNNKFQDKTESDTRIDDETEEAD